MTTLPTAQEILDHCPSCSSNDIKELSTRNELFSCNSCGLLFTNPRPTQDFVEANYCGGEYYKNFAPDDNWYRMWERRVKRITKRATPGKVLDVGAGIGTSLNMLKQKKFDITGTEISTEAIDRAKELYQIDLIQGYVEDQSLEDQSCDVITMWHVFEHLPFPGRTLHFLSKKIRQGGLIFIAVPNNTTTRLFLKPKTWFMDHNEKLEQLIEPVPYEKTFSEIHLIHYTPQSLRAILEREHFEIVEMSLDNISLSPGPFKDFKYMIRNFLARTFGLFAHKALFVCARKL